MGKPSWYRLVTGSALLLTLVAGPAAAEELQQRIDACAAIDDDAERLACFDALSSANGDGVYVPAAPEATSVSAAAPAPTSAVTQEEEPSPPIIAPAPARGEDKEKEVFNVRLTRCTQTSAAGRQVYYFDNGEVWRQSNSSRNNVRNCDAAVTIQKDVFGYKMHVASENRSIRISPVR